jgi:BASS family bile acid:Na+ symporter
MLPIRKLCLLLAGLGLAAVIVGLGRGATPLWQPAALVAVVGLAVGVGAIPALRGFQFTAWIVAAVTAAMIYPATFLRVGDFDLRNKWVVLLVVQTVMFGMGTQMGLKDFAGVMKMPWGVVVAVVGQFTIMPLVGFTLTKVFDFPPEVAAGIILIGSCSSGLASNVMCYLAKANLALSITATSITTLLAPLMTPLWMKLLAGTLVEVKFVNMMAEIIKIVIVPIGATMLHDYLKHASPTGRRVVCALTGLAAGWLVVLVLLAYAGWDRMTAGLTPGVRMAVELGSFGLGAIVAGNLYHRLTRLLPWLDRAMPWASMAGIVYFTTVTTAAGRDSLLLIGGLLFLAAALHNAGGYLLGYWLGRACGLDTASCRTVAIEVGLQNGGMASGLAGAMGKLGTVGLAAAIFSPWMNISGSILANFWRRRPPP